MIKGEFFVEKFFRLIKKNLLLKYLGLFSMFIKYFYYSLLCSKYIIDVRFRD